MKDSLLNGTTGTLEDEAKSESLRRIPHLTVLMTARLSQVGATRPLAASATGGEIPLHRGALAFGGEPLADRLISREQGVIRVSRSGQLEVVDHGSRHGTWLNGARLEAGVPAPLADGDRLFVGKSLLYVQALPHDPEGWERDAALRRITSQCRDRESQRSEERAMGEVHERLTRSALVGTTLGLRDARRQILAASRIEGPVLVTGPTGSGKEAVAAAIHAASLRRRAPFVAFSCAEVAPNLVVAELFGAVKGAFTGADRDRPGLWRSAARGTLFLDEVGDAQPELQAALLRAVESGVVRPVGASEPVEVDVRLVAATKRDLGAEVQAGRFRDDLLFRLAGTHIRLTGLAERPADALMLFAAGLVRFGLTEARLSREAIEALWHHGWPGNGREVMHLTERMVADAPPSGELRLPADFTSVLPDQTGPASPASPASPPARADRSAPDRATLDEMLRRHGGNLTAVARELGVRRQQVYRWLDRFGIALDDVRGGD